MSQESRDLCLEARIAAADLSAVRASVERWLTAGGRGIDGDGRAEGCAFPTGASVHVESGRDGSLSVFLHASGDEAGRTLAWHGSDLVTVLGRSGGEVSLTWLRHPPAASRAG